MMAQGGFRSRRAIRGAWPRRWRLSAPPLGRRIVGAPPAQAPPQVRFRAIKVDVSAAGRKGPRRRKRRGSRQDLPAGLRAAFAGRLAPGDAPRRPWWCASTGDPRRIRRRRHAALRRRAARATISKAPAWSSRPTAGRSRPIRCSPRMFAYHRRLGASRSALACAASGRRSRQELRHWLPGQMGHVAIRDAGASSSLPQDDARARPRRRARPRPELRQGRP